MPSYVENGKRHTMVLDRYQCLRALGHFYDHEGEIYVSFKPLMRQTQFDRSTVRRHCRALRRMGLADYRNGLWTYDGDLAGAGYRLTERGWKILNQVQGTNNA